VCFVFEMGCLLVVMVDVYYLCCEDFEYYVVLLCV